MGKAAFLDFSIEVIRRSDDQKGFSYCHAGGSSRRLVRDYEQRLDVSEATILIAIGGLLLRRNAHQ